MSRWKLWTLALVLGCTVCSAKAAAHKQGASLSPVRTNISSLRSLAWKYHDRFHARRGPLFDNLSAASDGPQGALNANPRIELIGLDSHGRPLTHIALDLASAHTIRTDEVWPGGASGYGMNGSTTTFNQFGMWDVGDVLETHRELQGRVVYLDSTMTVSAHATGVAGALIAAGVNPEAKGMSFAAELSVRDWLDDYSELAGAATESLLVSNHSYGSIAGWFYDPGTSEWYWYGDTSVSPTEDYIFGFYSEESQTLDEIADSAPNLTMVWAAGNDRGDGPPAGTGHYVWQDGDWTWSTATRELDGGVDGYDCIARDAIAKNVITVGAVDNIPDGYNDPSDVVITNYSSCGPVDDGRIKPDLVAPGQNVFTCYSQTDSSYATGQGTSMAAPNVAGSINLLVHQFMAAHGRPPLSSTMRALLIQTAGEAGVSPGPDYKYGWGLMNTRAAADLIAEDAVPCDRIFERLLTSGMIDSLYFTSDGNSPVKATLAWTDPAGDVIEPALNSRHPALVNDLDVRVVRVSDGTVYQPFCLDPDDVTAAAVQADNDVDNVEQVTFDNPGAGTYLVTITHKAVLEGGAQPYSLVVSGLSLTTDTRFTPPTDLTATLTSETQGTVALDWSHPGNVQDSVEVLAYDDGTPGGVTNIVGGVPSTHFSPQGPCEVQQIRVYTVASRDNVDFDVKGYDWVDGAPGSTMTLHYRVLDAENDGWNIIDLDPGELTPQGDFMLGFQTLDVSVAMGMDTRDNGRSWSLDGSRWRQRTGTYFIRARVRYGDGTVETLEPQGARQVQSVSELDDFVGYNILRNGSVVGTTSDCHYVDTLSTGGEFRYQVTALYDDGESLPSEPATVSWTGASVDDGGTGVLPLEFALSAWPNPFNPAVNLVVTVPVRQQVRLDVFNLLGRRMATLFDGPLDRGTRTFTWRPRGTASGVYFVRVQGSGGMSKIVKIMYLR